MYLSYGKVGDLLSECDASLGLSRANNMRGAKDDWTYGQLGYMVSMFWAIELVLPGMPIPHTISHTNIMRNCCTVVVRMCIALPTTRLAGAPGLVRIATIY